MDSLLDRITLEAGKCGSQPCIRKKRLRVCDILELLSAGATFFALHRTANQSRCVKSRKP